MRKGVSKLEILEVRNHNRDFSGGGINHSADVTISGVFEKNRELVSEVSIRVGYHPAGYGLYHFGVEKTGENEYHVEWETESSCD